MKVDIETLQDTFKIGYEAYEESRLKAAEAIDLYHNRQYTAEQRNILQVRGQPEETFNVIKLFARMLLGYYSTVVNTVVARPVQQNDIYTAAILTDLINYTFRHNNFSVEGDKVKLSGLLAGLMCTYVDVKDTGRRDEFGRPVYDIELENVPEHELVLDPMSRRDDYTDARFIHRFRWLSKDVVESTFGKGSTEKLDAYDNHISVERAEFEYLYYNQFQGKYRYYENYLIVHSILVDDKGESWSIFWSADEILDKKKVTYKEVKFPYRVLKVHTSDKSEYYGTFNEVIESQKAINQALIKLQQMVNSQKAFVQEGAVENLAAFTNAFNRVSAVIPVRDLAGIRIENLSQEVLDQYVIIDKAFDRIQRILGINDSFLGMAYASDSGRKVKLQQNATIMSLRYLTSRIEEFYRFLGWDIANLIKQYYTSHQVVRIADEASGERWIEINKPSLVWLGRYDQSGQPMLEPEFEEVYDPASGDPMVDEDGNYIVAPIPQEDTEIAFTDVDVEIVSTAYNDEEEKNQLMMETILNGPTGQLLAQVNPAGYFQASSLNVKTMKTKHSPEIAAILERTAQMLGANPQAASAASAMASGVKGGQQSPMSEELKLPQNTNGQ